MLQILLRFSAVALWLFASRADFKKPEALQNFGFLPGMISGWKDLVRKGRALGELYRSLD